MSRVRLGPSVVECVRGDIADQRDVEAVVNAANAELRPGGGVAGAIHSAAGPALYEECRPLAPIRPGEAVITGGHGLPNRYVIHCLGPVYGVDVPSDVLLADCYRNAMRLAGKRGITSIAFPAISAGVFGYPMEEAAAVAVRTVVKELRGLPTVRIVRFVVFDSSTQKLYEELLSDQESSRTGGSSRQPPSPTSSGSLSDDERRPPERSEPTNLRRKGFSGSWGYPCRWPPSSS